jgi:hypothetical protein
MVVLFHIHTTHVQYAMSIIYEVNLTVDLAAAEDYLGIVLVHERERESEREAVVHYKHDLY